MANDRLYIRRQLKKLIDSKALKPVRQFQALWLLSYLKEYIPTPLPSLARSVGPEKVMREPRTLSSTPMNNPHSVVTAMDFQELLKDIEKEQDTTQVSNTSTGESQPQ
jgi:hypothetical protein